jgi:hypothetical protein
MQGLKSQHPVESDRPWHLVGAQCDSADTLDHGLNSPVSLLRAADVATPLVLPISDTGRTRRQIGPDLVRIMLRISTLLQGVASEARSC